MFQDVRLINIIHDLLFRILTLQSSFQFEYQDFSLMFNWTMKWRCYTQVHLTIIICDHNTTKLICVPYSVSKILAANTFYEFIQNNFSICLSQIYLVGVVVGCSWFIQRPIHISETNIRLASLCFWFLSFID